MKSCGWWLSALLLWAVSLAACGSSDSGDDDAGIEQDGHVQEDAGGDEGSGDPDIEQDAGTDAGSDPGLDGAGLDAGGDDTIADAGFDAGQDAGLDAGTDAGTDAGHDAGHDAEPGDTDPGAELIIEQIHLPGFMGEAALIVGPDGTAVVVDTGGDSHGEEIVEAIDRRVGARRVDWVVVTHYHADHTGGFDQVFAPSSANDNDPVEVTQGVVSRGLFDIYGQFMADDSALRQYCSMITTPTWDGQRYDLCAGPAEATCTGDPVDEVWPASGCPGLLLGDLTDPADDGQGIASYLPLGHGARMTFTVADARVATIDGVVSAEEAGEDILWGGTGPENNRSICGVVRWGDFVHKFCGDLCSQMEDFVAPLADRIREAPGGPLVIPPGDLDTVHLSHHGLADASSQAWVDWLLPGDSASRNAVVGTNGGYWFSPSNPTLGRVAPRLADGYVWTTLLGTLPGSHARLRVADGAVVIRVTQGGSAYDVFALTASGPSMLESYTSTSP